MRHPQKSPQNLKTEHKSILIHILPLVLLIVLQLPAFGLGLFFHLKDPEHQTAWLEIGIAAATPIGAVGAAWLLYYRGELDRKSHEILERHRVAITEKLARKADRAKRRESFGVRLSKGIEHLTSASTEQRCAGMLELATLADDWNRLSKETLDESEYAIVLEGVDDPPKEQVEREECKCSSSSAQQADCPSVKQTSHRTDADLRCQEIIDLIFKPETWDLVPNGEEEQAQRIRNTRARIFRYHFKDTDNPWQSLDYTGIHLDHSWLKGLVFKDTLLYRARLRESLLEGGTFEGVVLKEAFLSLATLDKSTFTGVNLCGGDLRGASLVGSTFLSCDLSKTDLTFANLKDCQFIYSTAEESNKKTEGAHLGGASLVGASVEKLNFEKAELVHEVRNAGISDKEQDKRLGIKGRYAYPFKFSTYYSNTTNFSVDFDPRRAGLILDEDLLTNRPVKRY